MLVLRVVWIIKSIDARYARREEVLGARALKKKKEKEKNTKRGITTEGGSEKERERNRE